MESIIHLNGQKVKVLKNRSIEIMQSKNRVKKEWRKNEQSLREMWDTNVYQQTCKGSTRRTEKERSRKIFEKLVAKNFPFPKKFKSTYPGGSTNCK